MGIDIDLWLTSEAAANAIGIDVSMVRRLCTAYEKNPEKGLRSVRLGSKYHTVWLIDPDAALAYRNREQGIKGKGRPRGNSRKAEEVVE